MVIDTEIELPDQGDNIIRTKKFDYQPNPKGLGHELYLHLKKGGNAVAQQDAETEETETFEAYTQRIIRVVLHLRKRGITSEDVISPCSKIYLNTNVVFIAGILSGAKVACVDPLITYADGKAQIDLVKPKLIFISPESIERTEKIVKELGLETEIVVFGESEKHTPFSDFLKPLSKEEEDNFEPYIPKNLFETALIVFSSGSTGVPKGICINHYSVLIQTKRMMSGMMSIKSRQSMSYSPLAWVSAQVSAIISIFTSSCNLLCRDFDVEKTWKYLVKYDIGVLSSTPHNLMMLLKHGNPEKIATPQLVAVFPAGGKISKDSAEALTKMFSNPVRVMNGYGQTEIYGPVFSPKPKPVSVDSYVGDPVKGCWYKIVDPESGKICGPNEQGELCLKSKFVMNGYYNHDSSDRFDEDGYLKTGDVLFYDEEHSFYFVERYREALKYNQYWIAPSYLESILYQHPAVKIACVIGVPTDYGDIPTGLIVKADNAQEVTEEELVNYVNDRVVDVHKLYGGVIFIEESMVEFTPSGKLRRYFLRKKVLEKLKNK